MAVQCFLFLFYLIFASLPTTFAVHTHTHTHTQKTSQKNWEADAQRSLLFIIVHKSLHKPVATWEKQAESHEQWNLVLLHASGCFASLNQYLALSLSVSQSCWSLHPNKSPVVRKTAFQGCCFQDCKYIKWLYYEWKSNKECRTAAALVRTAISAYRHMFRFTPLLDWNMTMDKLS